MSDPYRDRERASTPKIDWSRVKGPRRSGEAKARRNAELLGLVGAVAPTVGTLAGMGIGALAGGPVGAGIGGAVGGGVGQVVGAGTGYAADQQTEPYDREKTEREQRMEAVMRLMQSRR